MLSPIEIRLLAIVLALLAVAWCVKRQGAAIPAPLEQMRSGTAQKP